MKVRLSFKGRSILIFVLKKIFLTENSFAIKVETFIEWSLGEVNASLFKSWSLGEYRVLYSTVNVYYSNSILKKTLEYQAIYTSYT